MRSKALIFSPDSRVLTYSSGECTDPPNRELFVISWDPQTGGVASIIRWQSPALSDTGTPSVTYSANGKIVGVYYCSDSSNDSDVFTFDVASGALIQSYSINDTAPLSNLFWTHGESLRFATVDTVTITIWEVGFASGAARTEVETLPTPDGFDHEHKNVQLLPAPFRLALIRQGGRVQVWNARNSRYLLDCADANFSSRMSFSSDGRFFACSAAESDIYLWKESPAGYILHGILTSSTKYSIPLLARNGESIIAFRGCAVRLWRTKDCPTPSSSILTRAPQRTEDFILEFPPDGTSAVVARNRGNTVTVLDLRPGVPQLAIDTSITVYGLGVIGSTVVVIGDRKVIAWNLPAGDCVPDACMGLEVSSWTKSFSDPLPQYTTSTSVSPDFRYVALIATTHLYIYDASTGECLGVESTGGYTPRFSPHGRDLWCAYCSGGSVAWRVGGGEKVLEPLENTIDIEHPPEGYHWISPRGYRVTNDWWILGPDGKRLLLLPPP